MSLCMKKIDNVQKEKRYLTVVCWICSEKTIQKVAANISDEIQFVDGP